MDSVSSPAADSPPPWLTLAPGEAPLVVSIPHTGTDIPPAIESVLVSPWLARKDADWWVDQLYDFAADLGATVVRTSLCRTVIDTNRAPSGASLYPGQATTELCPTTTFDGEPLYIEGCTPSAAEIATRRAAWFDPYHSALANQLQRLRRQHRHVVIYDCHSIRSAIPRLFDGILPNFNIGTNNGTTCAPRLTTRIEAICAATAFTQVTNGRFRGGYTTRHYGRPEEGIHAVQMELACRGYLREPPGPVDASNWPIPYDPAFAAPMRTALRKILDTCLDFARNEAV